MAAGGLTAFLAAGWRLLETEEPLDAPVLVQAWVSRFGAEPNLGEDGDATIGFHAAAPDPRERYMLIGRTASEHAVRAAIRLLIVRHDLVRVRPIGRPGRTPAEDQPHPRHRTCPISIWPNGEHKTRDAIVIAHSSQPLFVHRMSASPTSVGVRLTNDLEHALLYESPSQAEAWLESQTGLEQFALSYRSVVLARIDQALAGADHRGTTRTSEPEDRA